MILVQALSKYMIIGYLDPWGIALRVNPPKVWGLGLRLRVLSKFFIPTSYWKVRDSDKYVVGGLWGISL